jgi:hypothetical protein
MEAGGAGIIVYVVYVAVALALTAWLARTLFRSGTAFLHDVFADKPALADAVNRLLVVGFYMLNLGYALFIARAARDLDAFGAVQFVVNRLAILLVTLAGLHFLNVFVFWRIRTRREQGQMAAASRPAGPVRRPPSRRRTDETDRFVRRAVRLLPAVPRLVADPAMPRGRRALTGPLAGVAPPIRRPAVVRQGARRGRRRGTRLGRAGREPPRPRPGAARAIR